MRRGTKRAESTVPSPCIGTCLYDPAESSCLGCKRTPDEIREWMIMTDEQKQEVLRRIGNEH